MLIKQTNKKQGKEDSKLCVVYSLLYFPGRCRCHNIFQIPLIGNCNIARDADCSVLLSDYTGHLGDIKYQKLYHERRQHTTKCQFKVDTLSVSQGMQV